MSRTNVHSEKENNMYCAGAQIIATAKEVGIPPKKAKRGPKIGEVQLGEGIEIPAMDSKLHEDGTLVAINGVQVAKFNENAFAIIKGRQENREKARASRKTGTDRDGASAGRDEEK